MQQTEREKGSDFTDQVLRQVTALGAALLGEVDDLAVEATRRIQAADPIYRQGLVTTEQLQQTLAATISYVYGQLGRRPRRPSPESFGDGRTRARAGVPLTAVMTAYRVGGQYMWERLAAAATEAAVSGAVIVAAATEMWLVLDTFTTDMANGYREEITAKAIVEEQRRSTLVEAILQGQLTDTSLFEAADILRLPPQGPFVVIAATLAEPARSTRPQIANRLRHQGISSAWGMTYDTEVGIAALRNPSRDMTAVTAALQETGSGRVGVSSPYDSLIDSPQALRLARIAMRASTAERPVTVFERDPLLIAAVATPDIMRRLADITLAGLSDLPPAYKRQLLETFGAWLNNGGSASRAAAELYCHANTVRYRLRRLAEYTGRSLDDPRWIAELGLAYQIELADEVNAV